MKALKHFSWDESPRFLTVAVVVGIIAGLAAASGEFLYATLFAAAVMGSLIAVSPYLLFWITVSIGLVVAGVTQLYVPGLQQVRWLVILPSLVLVLHALMRRFAIPTSPIQERVPAIIWFSVAFILVTIFSVIVNEPSLTTILPGLKGYFQVWGLLFGLAFLLWPMKFIVKLPKVLFWVALLQVPFALHQYFVLVPMRAHEMVRHGLIPVDIVSGTFGGDIDGGGMNSLLAAFQIIVFAGLLGLRRCSLISIGRLFGLTAILLSPILVNQAKVSVIYLLIVFLVMYREAFVTRPVRALGAGLAMLIMLGIFLAAYTVNAPTEKVQTWTDLVKFTYSYNTGEGLNKTGKLTRMATLTTWGQHHGLKDIVGTLIGHGVAFSRDLSGPSGLDSSTVLSKNSSTMSRGANSLGSGANEIGPSIGIGSITVAALLWETGIIGLLCVFSLFWAAYRTAVCLERQYADDRWHNATFRATQAATAVLFVSLWHNNFFVFQVGYQTVVVLLFGYLAYWDRVSCHPRAIR